MEDPNQEKKSRFDLQPHYIEWGLTALGVIVACVLVVFVLFRMTIIWGMIKKFFGILTPFIYGFVMAYLLMPVFNMLYRNLQPPMSRKFKNGTRLAKGLCSALTLAFGLAVVGVLLWMVLPQLVTSITSLVDSMDLYMNEISGWVASLLHNNPEIEHSFMRLYDQFSAQIMNWAQNDLLPQLGNMMSGVVTTVNVLMNLLIGVIIALYILNSKDTFCAQAKKMTYSLFKVEKANAIMARVAHIHRVFGGVMGFAGMVIGVPLFAVLYSMLTEKINHLLKKRGLSVDTNDYRGHRRIDPETHAFVEAQETTPPVSAKERRRAANAAQQKNQENKNQ